MNLSDSLTIAPPAEAAEAGASQAVKAQLRLREMILAGELPGGARIAELTLVEKLGVSRTPIRAALMRLEQEGLLHRLPGGGYAVRTFSETDVADAIELRGTMEGLAARLAAERGVAPALLAEAHACLETILATDGGTTGEKEIHGCSIQSSLRRPTVTLPGVGMSMAVPLRGASSPARSRMSLNAPRSSARSMASGVVPTR